MFQPNLKPRLNSLVIWEPVVARPPRQRLTLEEQAIRLIDRVEIELRELIGRWHDSLPTPLRAQLTTPTNRLLRFLIQIGRR